MLDTFGEWNYCNYGKIIDDTMILALQKIEPSFGD